MEGARGNPQEPGGFLARDEALHQPAVPSFAPRIPDFLHVTRSAMLQFQANEARCGAGNVGYDLSYWPARPAISEVLVHPPELT